MPRIFPLGLGWKRDLPDFRDYVPESPTVQELLRRLKPPRSSRTKKGGAGASRARRPSNVDLREYFHDVYDQQHLNASTAHACVALVEYFDCRCFGGTVRPSRLFLHQSTRKLLRTTGDAGASLRTGLKAMVRFGIPPERYWPYNVEKLDEEPKAFLYSYSREYRPTRYVRLDDRNATGAKTLETVKRFLAAGFPSVFGFPVPDSISQDGDVPYRPTFDSTSGGQAVVAVGYDDRRPGAARGALLIRNSWGSGWGEDGYGWLPYPYVEEQLAVDFWTLLRPDWLDAGELRRPRLEK